MLILSFALFSCVEFDYHAPHPLANEEQGPKIRKRCLFLFVVIVINSRCDFNSFREWLGDLGDGYKAGQVVGKGDGEIEIVNRCDTAEEGVTDGEALESGEKRQNKVC